MATRRLLICNAIVAKLATVAIPGLTARWLYDGQYDENTEARAGEPPQAVVVQGSDSQSQVLSSGVAMELTGHVIYETNANGEMNDATREVLDEELAKVEQALLELHADPEELGIAGVTQFDRTEFLVTFAGGGNGRFAARLDWACNYRHAATDPREVP